jgi:hypothetical protein
MASHEKNKNENERNFLPFDHFSPPIFCSFPFFALVHEKKRKIYHETYARKIKNPVLFFSLVRVCACVCFF